MFDYLIAINELNYGTPSEIKSKSWIKKMVNETFSVLFNEKP